MARTASLRKRTVAELVEAERFWRRRRTIADNKIAWIQQEMHARLIELQDKAKVIENAIAGKEPKQVVAKRGAAREFNKETE